MFNRRLIFTVTVVGGFAVPHSAYASFPVPFEVVGCVKNGVFDSKGHIFPTTTESGKAGLAVYEGNTIEITGFLSPGDRLSIDKVRIVAADCQQELHQSKFLCDPCITR